MADCTFSFSFAGNAPEVLHKARTAVERQGGTFTGSTSSGNFQLSVFGNTIAGSYAVSGQTMTIVIDTKPFLLPCSTIEGFLKTQLGVA